MDEDKIIADYESSNLSYILAICTVVAYLLVSAVHLSDSRGPCSNLLSTNLVVHLLGSALCRV